MEVILAVLKEGKVSKVVLKESTTVEQDDYVIELA